MTSPAEQIQFGSRSVDPWRGLLIIIGALTLLRVVVLLLSPFNLGPDEAQYWSWSLEPAFGYFSKPPMIAWLIGLSTTLFGHGEWAVRLTAPFLHAGTALMIYLIGRDLMDERTGFWSAVTFATLPSVFFSSGLIATDTPLLFFWSIALFSFVRFDKEGGMLWPLLMGAAIGLGMMSKYAMVYFVLCTALYLAFTPGKWKLAMNPRLYLALPIAGLIILPNILWNANSGFATVTHTAANANWQGDMFNFDRMFDFILGQFGVFGPILFPILVIGAVFAIRGRKEIALWPALRLCLFYSLPIVSIATVQGFLSRANANWAATTYVAATLFVVGFLLHVKWKKLTFASLGLHLFVAGFFYILVLVPGMIESLGMSNAFKRVRGWDTIGAAVMAEAESSPYTAVMGDDRLITAELLYYARDLEQPLTYWDADLHPVHHYELKIPLQKSQGGRVLLVSRFKKPRRMLEHFESHRFLRTEEVATGVGKSQKVHLFELTGYKGREGDLENKMSEGK